MFSYFKALLTTKSHLRYFYFKRDDVVYWYSIQ
jgi:hypothetical protein